MIGHGIAGEIGKKALGEVAKGVGQATDLITGDDEDESDSDDGSGESAGEESMVRLSDARKNNEGGFSFRMFH